MTEERTQRLLIRGKTYVADVIPPSTDTTQVLLLVHGFTGSRHVFAPLIDDLRTKHRLVIPDMLGHGDSDAPDDSEQYTMREVVEDLRQLLLHLHISSADVFGYSMGGRIALGFACTHPEMVDRLILEGASPGLAEEQDRQARSEADDILADTIVANGVRSFVDKWERIPLFASQLRMPRDVWERQRAIRLHQRSTGLAQSLRGIGTGKQPSYWEHLSRLGMPILLLTGEIDVKFAEINHRMAKRMPHAHHVILKDAGHTPHLECPQAFLHELITFFKETNR